jgi:flagellar M-ring protein FliF
MATQLEASPEAPRLAHLMRMGPSAPQVGLVIALAAGLTLAAGVVMWAMRPSFVPLNSGMTQSNAGDVMARLQANNTPFEVDSRTGLILVPSNKLREIEVSLAADGLSGGESMGSEMLSQTPPMGASNGFERERYQHMRETELARSISKMRGVEAARVHLAIPKRTAFVRDRTRPSASVLLRLAPGRALDGGQVQGIANLVASSIPYLEISKVAVVDQYGRLLSRSMADSAMALSSRQFEYKQTVEQTHTERIESLLAPIIGHDRVRAQVHADLDFSEVDRRQEAYAAAPDKIRSEQIEEQRNASAGGILGVPGALTNQPPEGGSLAGGGAAAEGATDSGSNSKSVVRNFEMDKVVTRTRDGRGRLKRLSVAVLVDDKVTVGEDGTPQRVPREKAELDKITELVKGIVGFDAERGDSVVVQNSSFEVLPAIEPLPEPALWEQTWFESVVKNTLAAILMGLLLLLVLRPTVRALTGRGAAAEAGEGGGATSDADDLGLLEAERVSLGQRSSEPLPPPPRVYGDILNLAREMAAEDPKRVAMVLRRWVDGDE